MRLQGLKVHISTTLVLLLVIGMSLVIFVTVVLWQRDVLRLELDHSQKNVQIIAAAVGGEAQEVQNDKELVKKLEIFSRSSGAECVMVQPVGGSPAVFPLQCGHIKELANGIKQSLHRDQAVSGLFPPGRSFLFPVKQSIVAVAPVFVHQERIGTVGISVPSLAISRSFAENKNIILVYFIINVLILTVIGFFRLVKFVVRPIEKLVALTDSYSDFDIDGVNFLSLSEKNEFGRLSTALNRMLHRIETDRGKLRATVNSLEKANEQLLATQQEMVRTEKMASVGRLAAGLAHEIGNPLGIIQGYLELLQDKDISAADKKDFIARVDAELARINRLIRQLLDFSRPAKSEAQLISLHGLLTDLIDMVQVQARMKEVEILTDFTAEPDTVWADENQLKQVFLNCLLNAADAIAEKSEEAGRIEISTRLISNESATEEDQDVLRVTVRDNGIGIAAEDLSSVFDPFFTTKEPGRGTGLGLSVSHGIVENMGGSITAVSEKGQETSIIVELPLVK